MDFNDVTAAKLEVYAWLSYRMDIYHDLGSRIYTRFFLINKRESFINIPSFFFPFFQ